MYANEIAVTILSAPGVPADANLNKGPGARRGDVGCCNRRRRPEYRVPPQLAECVSSRTVQPRNSCEVDSEAGLDREPPIEPQCF